VGKRTLTIAARPSRLALRQAELVKEALLKAHKELEVEVVAVRAQGDEITNRPLSQMGETGIFTKEIERQLLAGRVDAAVHSLKDLPTRIRAPLRVAAVTVRADAADVLVSKKGLTLAQLPIGAKVLTGSPRRRAQLLHRRGDLQVTDVRGNVETRLDKLAATDAAALVLAAAGLQRLALEDRITERLEPLDFLPGCGQGALAVEVREDDDEARRLVAVLEDRASRLATSAERAMLRGLGGGCQLPLGAYAELHGEQLRLRGMVSDLQGKNLITAEQYGKAEQAEDLGRQAAKELLKKGASEILAGIVRNGRGKANGFEVD